jgi:single-stranded-DNA-specific exonuclease
MKLSLQGGSLPSFLERVRSMADNLSGLSHDEDVLVVTHLDADGLSAGSIMLQALLGMGFPAMVRVVKQLDEGAVSEINASPQHNIVFTDLGSGQKTLLRGIKGKKLFLVDHHQPEAGEDAFFELNPHQFGIDGSKEISAAGTAYLLATAIDPSNTSLVNLAIVGALGDLQDKGNRGTLTGINAKIAEEAEKAGILTVKKGLRLYGFESRPLVKCMEYTMDPYLPGLSGDEGACYKLIKDLGIDPRKTDGSWKSVADLSREELKSVINGLIKYLVCHGLSSREAESVVGVVYVFKAEGSDSPLRDAREFASSINACGRLGRYGLGISICIGDRERALNELKEVLAVYKRTISGYLNWLQSNPKAIRVLPNIQAVFAGDAIDDKMIGTVISIAMSSEPFTMDKPILGFANSAGVSKISGRGTPDLVRRGLNLGKILKEAAEKHGGTGGGHDIAAGAQVPLGAEEAFLSSADEIVKKTVTGVLL